MDGASVLADAQQALGLSHVQEAYQVIFDCGRQFPNGLVPCIIACRLCMYAVRLTHRHSSNAPNDDDQQQEVAACSHMPEHSSPDAHFCGSGLHAAGPNSIFQSAHSGGLQARRTPSAYSASEQSMDSPIHSVSASRAGLR